MFRENPLDPRRALTPMVAWIMGATAVMYFLQLILDRLTGEGASALLGLSCEGFLHGWIWQFVTYQFLHGGVLHILFNMMCLYMLGPELERVVGSARFLTLYLVSGIVGGAGWLAIQYPNMGNCIGASGAVFGVMAAFATMFPRLPLTVMFFPFLTLPAWVLVGILTLVQLAMLLDLRSTQVAYAAHLAGALAGFALAWMHRRGVDPAGWLQSRRVASVQRREEHRRMDVDQILDKLAREGLHTLTESERRRLDEESRRMRDARR